MKGIGHINIIQNINKFINLILHGCIFKESGISGGIGLLCSVWDALMRVRGQRYLRKKI